MEATTIDSYQRKQSAGRARGRSVRTTLLGGERVRTGCALGQGRRNHATTTQTRALYAYTIYIRHGPAPQVQLGRSATRTAHVSSHKCPQCVGMGPSQRRFPLAPLAESSSVHLDFGVDATDEPQGRTEANCACHETQCERRRAVLHAALWSVYSSA